MAALTLLGCFLLLDVVILVSIFTGAHACYPNSSDHDPKCKVCAPRG